MADFIKFDVQGTERIANDMQRRAAALSPKLNKVGVQWVQDETRKLQNEPPPPELLNQKYKRTGRFAEFFRAANPQPGWWEVSNRVKSLVTGKLYPVFVGGDGTGKGQADIHKGRWLLTRETIENSIPKLLTALRRMTDRIINGKI